MRVVLLLAILAVCLIPQEEEDAEKKHLDRLFAKTGEFAQDIRTYRNVEDMLATESAYHSQIKLLGRYTHIMNEKQSDHYSLMMLCAELWTFTLHPTRDTTITKVPNMSDFSSDATHRALTYDLARVMTTKSALRLNQKN